MMVINCAHHKLAILRAYFYPAASRHSLPSASCHGSNADGHGFVARALAQPPRDLRQLGEGNDTSLLVDRLVRVIDGRKLVTAHGEREMPVWGERFGDIQGEGTPREKGVRERINAIVAYLMSIQIKAP